MTIRIVLAEPHSNLLTVLRNLIVSQPGMKVIAEARTGGELLRLAGSLKPDVVVMDIHMPDLKGIDAILQLVSDTPAVRVLVLSMHANRQLADGMLAAGAGGYLLKERAFEELTRAIQVVAAGRIYLCPGIGDSVGAESA